MQVLLNQNENRAEQPPATELQYDSDLSAQASGARNQSLDDRSGTAAVSDNHVFQSPLQPVDRGASLPRSWDLSPNQDPNHQLPQQPAHSNRVDGAIDVAILSEEVRSRLIEHFYQAIFPIFPIIPKSSFTRQLEQCQGQGLTACAFRTVYYMLLAVSASVLPEVDAFSGPLAANGYKPFDLAKALYAYATTTPSGFDGEEDKANMNDVIAQGLRSLYLVEEGEATKAWITAGHAIRQYQGLEANHFSATDLQQGGIRRAHRNLWWCLYILDRSLSTALGKPLAFDDDDCDSSLSDLRDGTLAASGNDDAASPWFSVVADFHVTMAKIYTSIRSMRKENSQNGGGSDEKKEASRQRIRQYDAELQKYYITQVMPKMQGSNQPIALQTIAVSSYYIGLVLLYRTSIENFSVDEPDAFLRCAKAAVECIRVSPVVIANVPTSHFLVQQCRAIYASMKVILHCMRMARNPAFTETAWGIVEQGLAMLQRTKLKWPEIKKYQESALADMQSTQLQLQRHAAFFKVFDNFGADDNQEMSLQRPPVLDLGSAASTPMQDQPREPDSVRREPEPQLENQTSSYDDHVSKKRRINESERRESSTTALTPESPVTAPFTEPWPLANDFLLDFSSLSDATHPPTLLHDDSSFLSSIDSLLQPSEKWPP